MCAQVGEAIRRLIRHGYQNVVNAIIEETKSNQWTIRYERDLAKDIKGWVDHQNKIMVVSYRKPATVCHELVHVAGGNERDAETIENQLYTRKEGASPPTMCDFELYNLEKEPKFVG